jgi:diadenosine tetraphosphate (Ap4A) HIT family hydrolase
MASEAPMINATISKFGYPDTLVGEFDHWMVLLRPSQVTAGSLVIAAKSGATAFAQLEPAAFAELGAVVTEVEATLKRAVDYARINYLMLMMVDPHVHFHVFPRYEGSRSLGHLTIADLAWPGPPDLTNSVALDPMGIASAINALQWGTERTA